MKHMEEMRKAYIILAEIAGRTSLLLRSINTYLTDAYDVWVSSVSYAPGQGLLTALLKIF
jgi:hypothetical protein